MTLTSVMIIDIARHAHVTYQAITLSWKKAIAWRFSMVMSVLIDPIILTAYVFIWKAVFAATGSATIGGYTYDQMLMYYLLSAITFHLVWDDMEVTISDSIAEGTLTKDLLRPYSYFWMGFLDKIGHRLFALVIECVPVFLIALLFFDMNLVPYLPNLGWYFLSVALSFLLIYALRFFIGCTAFWTGRSQGVSRLSTFLIYLMSGGFFPLSLLPSTLQTVLFFLPFQYVSYVPMQAFIGTYTLGGITLPIWQIVLLQAAYIPLIVAAAIFTWRFALKRYSGAGT